MARKQLWLLLVVLLACGRNAGTSAAKRDDGGTADATPVVLARLVLGVPDAAAFAYRKRAGEPAFERAREAESRGDWQAVAAACRAALAADPNHLDAAYLLAVALAKTGGAAASIIEPLTKAVSGDFAKWGQASLDQPALQPFLGTPIGSAWRKRVEEDRQAFVAALARSLIVTAQGDLLAYDGETKRWYRLTRTSGAVVAAVAVPSAQRIAYVTRTKTATHAKRIGVGVIELGTGRTRRSIEVPTQSALRVGYAKTGFVVRAGKQSWSLLENARLELRALPPKTKIATPIRIEVSGRSGKLARDTVDAVAADWDERALASAIRIGTSHRVVTVPSPGLIDRNTLVWSPDRTKLAFVAQLDDTCAPGAATAAAFVADAATGSVSEVERAIGGIAVEWYAESKLAVAGDHGVSLVAMDGSAPIAVAGADGLVSPRRKPQCSPEPAGEEPLDEPDEITDVPGQPGRVGSSSAAGVH